MVNLRMGNGLRMTAMVWALAVCFTSWSGVNAKEWDEVLLAQYFVEDSDEEDVDVDAIDFDEDKAEPVAADDENDEGDEESDFVEELSPEVIEVLFALLQKGEVVQEYENLGWNEEKTIFTFRIVFRDLVYILVCDDTDAYLACSFEDKISKSRINEWNRAHRFSKVYLTDEGQVRLVSNFTFAETTIANFIHNLRLGLNCGKIFYDEAL